MSRVWRKSPREKIPAGGSVLYLAGEDRTGDLAGRLEMAGHPVNMIEIYRAVADSGFAGGSGSRAAIGCPSMRFCIIHGAAQKPFCGSLQPAHGLLMF